MCSTLLKLIFLTLTLSGPVTGTWLLDSITSRNSSDYTCHNNAHAAVSDPAGNIHIVWSGRAPDSFQVWYSRWDRQTREWGPDSVISQEIRSVTNPTIACDSSGNIYLAWLTVNNLKLKRRNFQTGEWEPADSLFIGAFDSIISLAVDRFGVQHLIWTQVSAGNRYIFYASHNSTGWTEPETVAIILPYTEQIRPQIASTPDGLLMAVWSKQLANQKGVLARRRLQSGWAQIETVYMQNNSFTPSVCAGQDSFYIVWVMGSANSQAILYRARGENGWGDTFRLNTWQWSKAEPSVACDESGALHVAWIDEEPSQRRRKICYRHRNPDGNWDTIQVLPSPDTIDPSRLSISTSNSTVQVAWTDRLRSQLTQVRLSRYEKIYDIGVVRLSTVPPADTVDSASVIRFSACIKNCGEFVAESVLVYSKIRDSIKTIILNSIGVNDSVIVFDSIFIPARNSVQLTCSTHFRNDAVHNNDVKKKEIFVRVKNLILNSILAPGTRVLADSIRPTISLTNAGNVPALSFTAACSIFSITPPELVYYDTLKLNLAPDSSRKAVFRFWQIESGDYNVYFRLNLPGDMHPENDTASTFCHKVYQDAGVEDILWPTGIVDSGTIDNPQVKIRNYGEESDTVVVKLKIGSDYFDTASVFLRAADSAIVRFDLWLAKVSGNQTVRCSTMFTCDQNPANDTLSSNVFVRFIDAGIEDILAPAGVINPGIIKPKVKIMNHGNQKVDLPVNLLIKNQEGTTVYWDSVFVTEILPAQDSVIVFPDWQAQSGNYQVLAWTNLPGDMNPENDSLAKFSRIVRHDVGVLRITAPGETVVAEVISPVVKVQNWGEVAEGFFCYLVISELAPESLKKEAIFSSASLNNRNLKVGFNRVVFFDSVFVQLNPADSLGVIFSEWQAQPGSYELNTWSLLTGDENPNNDSGCSFCYVDSVSTRRWRQLVSIPAGANNKPVREGGSLVTASSGIYAFKGGGSNEFWLFEPFEQSWSAKNPLPRGRSGKKIRAGAGLCWDGDSHIYALKGNNTREFWCYDIALDSWVELPPLPDWTKGIRYGAGIVYIPKTDTNFIFCLKGSGTSDFLVYWVKQSEWHARRPVPRGISDRPVRRGSALTCVGNKIFVLKGGTNEFYEYFVNGDSWRRCASLPLGRMRKCRNGAALTSDQNGYIYAFKGGNTTEFWRYNVIADTWEQLEDIPFGNRWHRVNSGAALAFWNGTVYAFKGGGSREFWGYQSEVLQFAAKQITAIIVPQNSVSRSLTIAGVMDFRDQSQSLLIFDPTGRRQQANQLRAGVYFILSPEQTEHLTVKKVLLLK